MMNPKGSNVSFQTFYRCVALRFLILWTLREIKRPFGIHLYEISFAWLQLCECADVLSRGNSLLPINSCNHYQCVAQKIHNSLR